MEVWPVEPRERCGSAPRQMATSAAISSSSRGMTEDEVLNGTAMFLQAVSSENPTAALMAHVNDFLRKETRVQAEAAEL